MKSRKAILSLLKVYPANLLTWVLFLLLVFLWGWKGFIGSYLFSIFVIVLNLFIDEGFRARWFSKNALGKNDWLVQWSCQRSRHVWGEITVEEPRTPGAELFLRYRLLSKRQEMRIGNGSCIFCDKKENFVSFPSGNPPCPDGHIFWDRWVVMSKEFYEMYREEQESAE